jgi:hypothetical protein
MYDDHGGLMRVSSSLHSEVAYAGNIIKAAADAANTLYGREWAAGAPLLMQHALASAVAGAAIGVLAAGIWVAYPGHRKPGVEKNNVIWGGIMGCAIGFAAALAWETRDHARRSLEQAARNIQTVRDAHWLEKHPIAYA